jgi:hypothetical protein
MKKQLILLLVASVITSNIDAAAQRFYNWCVNNRSRIALTSAALSSGAAAYYWKNRNQSITERPYVIECPSTVFEGSRKEDIQICGNEPAPKPKPNRAQYDSYSYRNRMKAEDKIKELERQYAEAGACRREKELIRQEINMLNKKYKLQRTQDYV